MNNEGALEIGLPSHSISKCSAGLMTVLKIGATCIRPIRMTTSIGAIIHIIIIILSSATKYLLSPMNLKAASGVGNPACDCGQRPLGG